MTQIPREIAKTVRTPSHEKRLGNITEEGEKLIQDFLTRLAESDRALPRDPEFFDGLQHWHASGGRIIVEFPDEHIANKYFETPYDTRYVVKLTSHNSPDVEIFKEIETWKRLHDHHPLANHLAPVEAWGENYQWVLMRRVWAPTDMSDRADGAQEIEKMVQKVMDDETSDREVMEELLSQGEPPKEIPPDALFREDMEALFEQHGWKIQDADENTGYDHTRGHTCLYDFGGVNPTFVDEDDFYRTFNQVQKEHKMPGDQSDLTDYDPEN